jgi:uncharacterized protein YggU (UPF0235/DUF167 family)
MLINFFAKLFKISKSSVNIAQGKQSRKKKIVLEGVDVAEIKQILLKAIT